MKLNLTKFENVTPAKVAFVEEQANKMLAFVLESRAILTREAHTTLQWLFAIIVGGSGYAATLMRLPTGQHVKWWLMAPLTWAVAVAAFEAVRLFHSALRAVEVLPMGNEPAKLATDELMAYDVHWMRLAEAAQLQERIEKAVHHNSFVGDAINEARWVVALLPILALLAAGIWWLISS
ncbi:MAG: hypothetical protein ABL921_28875 [Pirellula sp.]